MRQDLRTRISRLAADLRLPAAARAEARADRRGLGPDPGARACIDATLGWLGRAQDCSASADGGFARHWSWIDGWAPSYPETTGYIIPTLLEQAHRRGDDRLRDRARRALEWLVSIQLPEGAFAGGVIGQQPVVPVTFNTGQILIGLAAGVREFGGPYEDPMHRAARWLASVQDEEGAWSRFTSPFASPGPKAYDAHISWGLAEAARVSGEKAYESAVRRNLEWTVRQQRPNGWFDRCCLTDFSRPLTHTIGYVLRGLVEGHALLGEDWMRAAAIRGADALLGCLREDGFLPGRLDADWRPCAGWACLTGAVQIAAVWLKLSSHAPRGQQYLDAARRANQFVRRTVRLEAPRDIAGGVKGSWPADGEYGRFQLLNWAAKFAIDAWQMEIDAAASPLPQD
ncbi:MAG: terpene cyclase/mutase family protein [Bryobacteraceae bacterium]|nr:terpene cyclase/mutase family protein [Bryobacteraceae bacterium]MCX7602931.1 terpene cyclase/mutase family protein [Bryobacteraceae bacterium]